MNIKNILQQVNGKFIAIHLIAAWFCEAATATLFLLSDVSILKLVGQHKGPGLMDAIRDAGISTQELSDYTFYLSIGELTGLFIALILSGIICAKLKMKWFNLLLLLIAYLLLNTFIYNVPDPLRSLIYRFTGTAQHTVAKVIINGCLLAAIALVLYFSNRILLFIKHSPNSLSSVPGKTGSLQG